MFSVVLSTVSINAFDVKALRAFRVLRPLKLVSGVPSQYSVCFCPLGFHSNNIFTVKVEQQFVWSTFDETGLDYIEFYSRLLNNSTSCDSARIEDLSILLFNQQYFKCKC